MVLGDRVDQFLNEHGLAHARAAEQPDLAAAGIRREQVDDLDARDENLRFRRLVDEGRRILVDGAAAGGAHGAGFVHRLADDVDDASESAFADGNRDRLAGVFHLLTAHEAFGDVHRHGAHGGFAQMLRHFEHKPVAVIFRFERVHDRRQIAFELHVHDGAHHLCDAAGLVR